MENPIEMDDLGVPLFLETPILFWSNSCLWTFRSFQLSLQTLNIWKIFSQKFDRLSPPKCLEF